MASCTCKSDEACSECPPKIDDVRGALLKRILRDVKGDLPADTIRNLATAYGILTDKKYLARGPYSIGGQTQRIQ